MTLAISLYALSVNGVEISMFVPELVYDPVDGRFKHLVEFSSPLTCAAASNLDLQDFRTSTGKILLVADAKNCDIPETVDKCARANASAVILSSREMSSLSYFIRSRLSPHGAPFEIPVFFTSQKKQKEVVNLEGKHADLKICSEALLKRLGWKYFGQVF